MHKLPCRSGRRLMQGILIFSLFLLLKFVKGPKWISSACLFPPSFAMDGLSGASGVIAVVSVAIQLAECIKQLVEFGKAVEDAPPRISALFHALEVLESVLSHFHRINSRIAFDDVNEAVLNNCQQRISALLTTIQPSILKLQSNKLASRTWSAFKITLRREEIQLLQRAIEEAKSTLQLVQNNSLL
jgi:hypothetical protein